MTRRRKTPDRWRETVGFWLIVFLVCIVAGVISYQVGKNWVGGQLAEISGQAEGVQVTPEDDSQVADQLGPVEPKPPLTPQVTIEQREPSDSEKRAAQQMSPERAASREPQDGAELHAQPAAAPPEAPSTTSGYAVTAGSYASRDNAQRVVQRLTEAGYQPYITEVEKQGVVYQRVNVAVFDDRGEAEGLRDKLQQQGFVSGVMAQ